MIVGIYLQLSQEHLRNVTCMLSTIPVGKMRSVLKTIQGLIARMFLFANRSLFTL